MAYDETLVVRVRQTLSEMGGADEISMMGGLCFMRGGNMACGVSGERLMVRLGNEAAAKAAKAEDVALLQIGGGRIARAFVTVDPASIADPSSLAAWVSRGVNFADRLPPKNR
ncbi:TfoX/Sxy family protein [Paracoccus aurantiacus]|uniref:TfoX/Sxy family protein n=1 Tax=Paracoccus aurantiacus TaxID=2599412 RepID=A0A5C6RZU1_9RHOB|nr:TfoX/Sxy family protein [Paracoccus aurantiacus]TXB67821.1 TfoX/Sxy family protein [Paracoccus aurantiacus]